MQGDPFMEALGLPHDHVESIISSAVRRVYRQFQTYPDYRDRADLASVCRVKIIQRMLPRPRQRGEGSAMVGYVRERNGRPSVWVYQVAADALKDLLRTLTRRQGREDGYRGQVTKFWDTDEDLIEWLEDVYVRARAMLDIHMSHRGDLRKPKAQQNTSDMAQAAAMLALQRKLGLSIREMSRFCAGRPELCRVVGFEKPPSCWFFHRAAGRVAHINFSKAA